VFYRGKQVGSFRSYNDRLLIRLLERRRPSPKQQEALRAAEALGARLKAVEQREVAVREREEALRRMSPTVSVPARPPIPSPSVSVALRTPTPSDRRPRVWTAVCAQPEAASG
jgi:hypothetical protein